MVDLTGFWDNALPILFATVVGAAIVAFATAAAKTVGKHQREAAAERELHRRDAADMREVSTFLFGAPANPRTGSPAITGWTAKVDTTLSSLDQKISHVLAEVTPDGNGGHNLRGAVEKLREDNQ